jgi:8-oxo-dGTP pyrophosphatase MutT (NUDIX family)
MNSDPYAELVDVVDDAGRIVGTVTRRELRARRLPHRCAYVLVFNSRCELFVHQRTATKDIYPSYFDVTIGGVLSAGESFDEGARRETFEELGVAMPLEPLFDFRYADELSVVRGMVYRGTHDGPFILQPEEVVTGSFMPLREVARQIERLAFCPDGVAVLKAYRERFERHDDTSRKAT